MANRNRVTDSTNKYLYNSVTGLVFRNGKFQLTMSEVLKEVPLNVVLRMRIMHIYSIFSENLRHNDCRLVPRAKVTISNTS